MSYAAFYLVTPRQADYRWAAENRQGTGSDTRHRPRVRTDELDPRRAWRYIVDRPLV
jgi:hypothetical protein